MNKKALERRDFLKLGAAGLVVMATGPRMISSAMRKTSSSSSESDEGSPHSWAMVIDQSKCVGCGHCVQACKAYNDVPPNIEWTRIVEDEEKADQQTFLPIPCMHCAEAPCTHVCLVGATYSRPDGIVMMDYGRCIGCRYCEVACPYGVRSFNWEAFTDENPAVPTWGQPEVSRRPRGVVEKCSFCYQRIDRGLKLGLTPGLDQAATPACVVGCPMKARTFGDLNDPESSVSKQLSKHSSFRLREGLGTEPRVYYLPVHNDEVEEKAA